ncbi:sterol desaturase family protein [Aestuariivirga litoralis]|uniref:sterol desaturase family protein n=1 Tax=Aestuariivirga litoralis TaxID=2650924 RepID=UPI0018C78716|nr:sterol desaturase family protein [Aestuariivirga litoralis]
MPLLASERLRDSYSLAKEVFLALFTVRMSPVAFHLDYFAFPPIILGSIIWGAQGLHWYTAMGLFIVGLACWTLAEYVLHRYALHHLPWFSDQHTAHHEAPRAMIASPTVFSFAFFYAFGFVPVWLLFGFYISLGWFAGFLTGYVMFGAVHEMVHHSQNQWAIMRYWKRLHAIHHHGNSDRNFGVITGFWDHVFGTYENKLRRVPLREIDPDEA